MSLAYNINSGLIYWTAWFKSTEVKVNVNVSDYRMNKVIDRHQKLELPWLNLVTVENMDSKIHAIKGN